MTSPRESRRQFLSVIGGAASALGASSLLAACGQSGPAVAPAPTANAAPTAASAQPAARGQAATKKLRYLYNATPGVDEQVHLDLVTLYNKRYPDVAVEKIRVPDDAELTRKLLAMLAAHDLPDLFWNRQRTAPPFIDRGVLLDLSPLIATDKIDVKDFWPSAIQTYGRGGKLYGLPNSSSSNAYYFNADLFKAAGVELPTETAKKGPWNWDAVRTIATRLTKGDGPAKQFGFNQVTSIYAVDMYIWQNGGDLWDDQVTTSYLDQPADVAAIQWLVDNVVKYKVSPSSLDTKSGGDLFAGGRIALEMAGRYVLPSIAKSKFEVGMVLSPDGPKANTTRGDDLAASILKDAPNRENAWNFATMWSSDDGQQIVLSSRRSFTARRSFAQSDAMKKNLLPWESLDVYTNGLERTKAYHAPAQTGQVNTVFDRELDLMYTGEKSVKDGTDTMKRDIDAALKQPI